MQVHVMMSNSRSIIGIWPQQPTLQQQIDAYQKFLGPGEDVDSDTVGWNTWVEEHDIEFEHPDTEKLREIEAVLKEKCIGMGPEQIMARAIGLIKGILELED